MCDKTENGKPAEGTTPAKRHWWKIILCSILGLIAVLVFLVWGTKQTYPVSAMPEEWETAALQSVMKKVSESLLDGQGNVAAEAVMRLSPEEINALLLSWRRTEQQKSNEKRTALYLVWKDGALYSRASQPLFLGAINVKARIIPGLNDKKIRLRVDAVRVGWLPIPAVLVQSGVDAATVRAADDKKVQAAMTLFDKISVTDQGELELKIYPRNIGELIKLLMTK